jgi:hypothetical protein
VNTDVLAIVLIFGGGTLFLLAVSPIGRAVADRIRGPGARPATAGWEETMTEELQALRREVAELGERLDFVERLQVRAQPPGRLPPPES